METTERLYRSKVNKVIGGVAGGLADYFNIDVVLARVVFVLLAFFGGGGVLIYIVMWIIVPAQNGFSNYAHNQNYNDSNPTGEASDNESSQSQNPGNTIKRKTKSSNTGLITGVVLIFLGLLFLADRILPWHNIAEFWPLLLVFVGVLIIKPDLFKPSKKQTNEI